MENKKRLQEFKSESIDKIVSTIKSYKKTAVDEMKQTRLLVKIIINTTKDYIKNKDFELSAEDKKFILNQSSDIIKLIPLVVLQIIPGGTIASHFLIKLGKKLGIKLNTEIPKKYQEKDDDEKKEEMTELVDSDGTFAGSNIPILNLGLHPRKTQDQTVITTRQTNNPVVRGYRVYYGESVEDKDEKLLDEVDMSDAFGYEETEESPTYDKANKVLKKMGIADPFERHDRLETMGFDPELDKELKYEKKRGRCKNCFTKRRLSETEKQGMIKMIDEILLDKKNKSDDIVSKEKDSKSPINKILVRNLQSIKRIAEREGININQLIKILKTGE
jgi:hypothetical protein